jgi:hypothetical protein
MTERSDLCPCKKTGEDQGHGGVPRRGKVSGGIVRVCRVGHIVVLPWMSYVKTATKRTRMLTGLSQLYY